jgi:hypothetical protein
MQKGVQRELRPESIPETVVGVHLALMYLTVLGTVIDRRTVFVVFVELPGEEHGTKKAE